MRISVAMCTRNGARFVEAQLRSILDGTRRPDELVVVDDDSTDGTPELVAALLADEPALDVRLERNRPALGVTANFARAIGLTTGEVIVLADQDDRWHPERLATIAAALAAADAPLLRHSDAALVDADGAPLGATLFGRLGVDARLLDELRTGPAYPHYLRRNLATGATTALRRPLLDDAVPFPADWVHDEWLAVLAAARGSIAAVGSTELDYRQHGANEIGVAAPTLRRRIARVLAPEPGRNAALARRSAQLAERLRDRGLPDAAAAAEAKAAFEARRAALPRRRIARVPGVLRLLAGGGYGAYASQGRLDVVRDLLQPR